LLLRQQLVGCCYNVHNDFLIAYCNPSPKACHDVMNVDGEERKGEERSLERKGKDGAR
jgi:hypothetical protein